MAFQAETASPPAERTPSPPREKDPLVHDKEIEQQQDIFWDALKQYQGMLTSENLRQEVPLLAKRVLEENGSSPESSELQQATRFFALATAAEVIRTGHHQPNWPQAEASLHLIFPYKEKSPQRIQMAPGEGKTFTIAIAALWEAAHGKYVTVHTDKQANVNQSHEAKAGLYELFNVTHGAVQDSNTLGPDYYKSLMGVPPYSELPLVRYGTWSQFMHEYLNRQQIIFQTEAYLRGDTREQRQMERRSPGGGQLTPESRQQLEAALAYQKAHIQPDFIPVDEGDLSMDMEDSPVIISQEDEVPLSQRERDELQLAWEMYEDQAEGTAGRPGTLDQITSVLQYDSDKIKKRFDITPKEQVEGLEDEDAGEVVTSERAGFNRDTFYTAKLLEATVLPEKLAKMLKLMNGQYDEGILEALPLPLKNVQRLQELAEQAASSDSAGLDWLDVEEALPALTREDLRLLFSKGNEVFNYESFLRSHPDLRKLIESKGGPVTPADLEKLEEVFGDGFEQFMQRLTIQRLMKVVSAVWEPMANRYSTDILNVKYLMREGDNYEFVDGEAVLLGEDRQPQPGKEFSGNTQAFLHLKHNAEVPEAERLPIPEAKKTIAQILPITWYQKMARHANVTSLSGTQDEPDFEVESTGTSQVDVLPTRLFETKEQKLRAIAAYVGARGDKPILLCAQNYLELKQLEEMIRKLPGRELQVLDARHADQAGELVSQLGKGKILLLQITARGLDFGHLLDDGQGHSFEDGLIISANQLPDTHQQQQMEGRLGGKRPSGSVLTFSALNDKLAQEFYSNSPETSQKRHEKMATLEKAYEQLKATHNTAQWPESLGEALMGIAAWDETHQETDRGLPFWMRIAKGNQDFQRLSKKFDGIQRRHVRDLEKQQDRNIREKYDNRREQMVIDVVVQNLWLTIMNPTEETPLGKTMLPLTHEQRQEIVERLFDEASYLYPISAQKAKEDNQAPKEINERNKMAQFMKDLVERVTMWVDLERMERRYQRLTVAGNLLTDRVPLPQSVAELSTWLEQHDEQEQNEPQFQKTFQNVARSMMLGLRMLAEPENLEPLPTAQPAAEAPQAELRRTLFKNLREVANQENEIRRKFQAEK